MQGVLDHFLAAESDVYLILQLKDGPETADVRFEPFARLEQMGKTPNPAHYEVVYFANTPAYFYGMSNAEALEELYLTFNLKRPPDFRGHSLIEVLTEMRSYLTWSEAELRDLTDSTLDKLAGMSDAEFDALELYPDFI